MHTILIYTCIHVHICAHMCVNVYYTCMYMNTQNLKIKVMKLIRSYLLCICKYIYLWQTK